MEEGCWKDRKVEIEQGVITKGRGDTLLEPERKGEREGWRVWTDTEQTVAWDTRREFGSCITTPMCRDYEE